MKVGSEAGTLPQITVSLGLAVFPLHGGDGESLLQAADVALYEAKRAGRNRLAVAGATAANSASARASA